MDKALRWRFALLGFVVVAVVLFIAVMLWASQFS
jgi:hypothetical protein